jgi:phosphoribosylanthranilate isomerase
MSIRIKICGITNSEDARAAVKAGADALGFMFYEPSPRNVSLPIVAKIVRDLPPFVARVGVFAGASEEFIRRVVAECKLDTLQFHGNESPEFCGQFAMKTIKAFRIRGPESLPELAKYDTSAWLLDSFAPGKLGGTGAVFNWGVAVSAKELGRSIILAGGLTPENVAEAVRQVRPFGVDVSSGVEREPGRKDYGKLRAFILAARQAAEAG